MPCNCDHLEATQYEKEADKIVHLLDEIKYGTPIPANYGHGYDDRTYNKTTKESLDKLTEKLCTTLKGISDVTSYSLEMQIWWRDHQKADRERGE